MKRNLLPAAIALAASVGAAIFFAQVHDPNGPANDELPEADPATSQAVPNPKSAVPQELRIDWNPSFSELALSGPAGVTVVGHGHPAPVSAGPVKTGAAWSTIKVPLAVAAAKHGGSASDARVAITASDNPAAQRLWNALGSSDEAGRYTEEELRLGGDNRTKVETRQVVPPYSSFGQTQWALADQASYASTLQCREDAREVVKDMSDIVLGEQVGFGATNWANRTRYKVGWGPAANGGYLARELAVVTTKDGRIYGVSIAVQSMQGARAAQRDLTTIAKWLTTRILDVPADDCDVQTASKP